MGTDLTFENFYLKVERLKLRQRIIKEETASARKRLEQEEEESVNIMREQVWVDSRGVRGVGAWLCWVWWHLGHVCIYVYVYVSIHIYIYVYIDK